MEKLIQQLKERWDEDPLGCVVVGTIGLSALATTLNKLSEAQGRRAYAKQVNYRVKHGL